jgi:hypothetical protein
MEITMRIALRVPLEESLQHAQQIEQRLTDTGVEYRCLSSGFIIFPTFNRASRRYKLPQGITTYTLELQVEERTYVEDGRITAQTVGGLNGEMLRVFHITLGRRRFSDAVARMSNIAVLIATSSRDTDQVSVHHYYIKHVRQDVWFERTQLWKGAPTNSEWKCECGQNFATPHPPSHFLFENKMCGGETILFKRGQLPSTLSYLAPLAQAAIARANCGGLPSESSETWCSHIHYALVSDRLRQAAEGTALNRQK